MDVAAFNWFVVSPLKNTADRPDIRPGVAWFSLIMVVGILYQPVIRHQFVNFDDPMFLTENSHVIAGLTKDSLRWAWTNKDAVLWQPLAWMGHMAVSTVAGMRPAPHLLVNVAFHALNAGLLYSLLRSWTGRSGRSLVVALLFAVHPVNVETVAWASQLKSTLSTFFFLLGLLLYGRDTRSGRDCTATTLLAFALSLLAKPMLLFFPAVLMLVDFWPLQKIPVASRWPSWGRWIKGKSLYLLLAVAMLAMTAISWAKPAVADMASMELPGRLRLAAVPVNYVEYLRLIFWPADLAVMYPEQLDHPALAIVGAVALLLGVSAVAWVFRRRTPALFFGWGWFLLTMIPASGLLRAGQHGLADRYLYVPGMGIIFGVVWLIDEVIANHGTPLKAALVAGLGLTLGTLSHAQLDYWQNSVALWQHALAVTPPNAVAQINFGNALLGVGRDDEAKGELTAALELEKRDPRPYINLAVIAQHRGDPPEAIQLLRQAVVLAPADARIYSNLGSLLDDTGESAEARQLLEKATTLQPDLAGAWLNLGVLRAKAGELTGALNCFETAARLNPRDQSAAHNLQLVRQQIEAQRALSPR